jgi:2-dehydropantoate 2-reductase
MRVLVMGAGGVGGYYGSRLLDRGHPVTLVARGAHLEAIRTRGLEVRSAGSHAGPRPVHAVADPGEAVAGADLVLFTVKGYDTEAAARALVPALGAGTVVLTLQNGVEAAERVGAVVGLERVLAGSTVVEAAIVAPGVVEQRGPTPRIVLGEPSGAPTLRVEAVAALFRDAGVETVVTADARRALWEKFVRLAPGATLTSACQAPIGVLRQVPETAALYRALVAEAAAVGRAAGVALPADAVDAALAFIWALPPAMTTSMQRDFERGRPVELEELTGTVVRLGARLGVPVPAFAVLYAILKARAPSRPGGHVE